MNEALWERSRRAFRLPRKEVRQCPPDPSVPADTPAVPTSPRRVNSTVRGTRCRRSGSTISTSAPMIRTPMAERGKEYGIEKSARTLCARSASRPASSKPPRKYTVPTKSNNIGGQGGARPGAGRKKTAAIDKIADDNKRVKILDIPDVEGAEMPKPNEILSARQKNGESFQAKAIYETTWAWLQKIGCAAKVSPQLLGAVRHVFCSVDSVRGDDQPYGFFLSKHPTTRKADPVPVHQHRHQLHEPGGSALERDLPDRQRKLQHGVFRG
jgi:hypothetical protein